MKIITNNNCRVQFKDLSPGDVFGTGAGAIFLKTAEIARTEGQLNTNAIALTNSGYENKESCFDHRYFRDEYLVTPYRSATLDLSLGA